MSAMRRESDDCVVLTLTGDLDLETVPQPTALLDTLRNVDIATLVLDLGAVRFMDSTGLAFLYELDTSARRLGMSVRLRAVPPRVSALLKLTSLQSRFTIDSQLTPEGAVH